MTASDWVFILAGIAGVLVLAALGATRFPGIRAAFRGEPAEPLDTEGTERHEVRAEIRVEDADEIVRRLESLRAASIDLTPLRSIQHLLGPAEDGDGLVRIEVGAEDEADAWEIAEALLEIDAEGGRPVDAISIRSVEDVL